MLASSMFASSRRDIPLCEVITVGVVVTGEEENSPGGAVKSGRTTDRGHELEETISKVLLPSSFLPI
jgi:hypothetical protein